MTPADTPSARTRLKRLPHRGHHDLEVIRETIDAIPQATVAFNRTDGPYCYPTLVWRSGDRLYWHGSSASSAIRSLGKGIDVCVNLFVLDELVLARSAMHHSANYRSVTIFGRTQVVHDTETALRGFVDHYFPGRWDQLRPMTDAERRATTVISVDLNEASVKIRNGTANESDEDRAWPVWGGSLAFAQSMHPNPDQWNVVADTPEVRWPLIPRSSKPGMGRT